MDNESPKVLTPKRIALGLMLLGVGVGATGKAQEFFFGNNIEGLDDCTGLDKFGLGQSCGGGSLTGSNFGVRDADGSVNEMVAVGLPIVLVLSGLLYLAHQRSRQGAYAHV